MYKIGELSKLCSISVKTLRYYDAEGLLVPDEIDKFTGYRYYSASKLEDCYRIIALKELGFSLEEIRVQLTADDNARIAAALEEKLNEFYPDIRQDENVEFIPNNKFAFYRSLYLNIKDEVCLAGIRLDGFTHLKSNNVSMLISNAEHVISEDNNTLIKDINKNPKFLETYEYRWLDMYYTHSQKIRNKQIN